MLQSPFMVCSYDWWEAGNGQHKGVRYPGRQSLVMSQNPKVHCEPSVQLPLINHVSEWQYEIRLHLFPSKDRSGHPALQGKFVFWCHSFSSLADLTHVTASWVLMRKLQWSFVWFFFLIIWCLYSFISSNLSSLPLDSVLCKGQFYFLICFCVFLWQLIPSMRYLRNTYKACWLQKRLIIKGCLLENFLVY